MDIAKFCDRWRKVYFTTADGGVGFSPFPDVFQRIKLKINKRASFQSVLQLRSIACHIVDKIFRSYLFAVSGLFLTSATFCKIFTLVKWNLTRIRIYEPFLFLFFKMVRVQF